MGRLCLILLSMCIFCAAQQPASSPLTGEQQALFTAAKKDFAEHHPDLALEKMKKLHAIIPDNATITDGTAETAVILGDDAFALSLLKPQAATHPEDSFALEWLVRAYAESGDQAGRDSTIAALLKLHESTSNPAFRREDRFMVERIKLESGALEIYQAFVPYSGYHIYRVARQVDANNALVRQITLESNDADQPGFAQQKPELATRGMRRFSMDTYSASRPGADGTPTQTQALIAFIDGEPTYDEMKARMLKVANGAAPPMASRSGLTPAKPN